jgi:hypothetical protein
LTNADTEHCRIENTPAAQNQIASVAALHAGRVQSVSIYPSAPLKESPDMPKKVLNFPVARHQCLS